MAHILGTTPGGNNWLDGAGTFAQFVSGTEAIARGRDVIDEGLRKQLTDAYSGLRGLLDESNAAWKAADIQVLENAIAHANELRWDQPTSLSGTLDFDTLTTPGVYNTQSGSNPNAPFVGLFTVDVRKVSAATVQIAVSWNHPPSIYIRSQKVGGGWNEWIQFAKTADVESARWLKLTNIGSWESVDTVTTPGLYQVPNSSTQGLPVNGVGVLQVLPINKAIIQSFVQWGPSPRLFWRSFAIDGTPNPWQEIARKSDLDALATRVTALENVDPSTQTPPSGMKLVPLTMTAPGTPASVTMNGGAVRWSRRYAVMPRRVRVHVANANTGNALTGNKPVTLAGIRVGVSDSNGAHSQGVLAPIPTGSTLPADGSEFVTPWFDTPALVDGGYMGVTVSWWGSDFTLQVNQGGGWTTSDNTLAGAADTSAAGWTRSQTTPLHCWVEAEVPATTPVLCGHGDSITVGTATTDPVGDSWAAMYAYDQGALPVILAMHGSTMASWVAGSVRWKQFGSFDLKPVVDATVSTLGQNDLVTTGMDLATLQARHTAMMSALREVVSGPIYLGTITPSNKAAEVEVVRRSFNTWRLTLPNGERGVFDFALAVDDGADENLAATLTTDGLHPNTAGQELMADVVLTVPPTPYTAPPSKLKALLATV